MYFRLKWCMLRIIYLNVNAITSNLIMPYNSFLYHQVQKRTFVFIDNNKIYRVKGYIMFLLVQAICKLFHLTNH